MTLAFGRNVGSTSANTSATTLVLTAAAAANVGELCVVAFAWWGLNGGTLTVTDSKGNAWTPLITKTNGINSTTALAYSYISTQIAISDTITGTLSQSSASRALGAMAFTGFTGIAIDDRDSAIGTSGLTVDLITTTFADAALVYAASVFAGTSWTPATGFTEVHDVNTGGSPVTLESAYKIVSALGTTTMAPVAGTPTNSSIVAAAFGNVPASGEITGTAGWADRITGTAGYI